MEDFFDSLFRGNVAEVKVVLATVLLGLALYQVALMAVGYGKVRACRYWARGRRPRHTGPSATRSS
jgi:hypothetical protein